MRDWWGPAFYALGAMAEGEGDSREVLTLLQGVLGAYRYSGAQGENCHTEVRWGGWRGRVGHLRGGFEAVWGRFWTDEAKLACNACVHRTRPFVYNAHMGSAFVDCWKCDVCGHRWIKTEIVPTHCPSKLCRSRKYDQNPRASAPPAAAPPPRPSPPPADAPYQLSPGIRARRDQILSAPPPKMNDAMARFMAASPTIASETPADDPVALCGHKEWAEDGEQYRCRLAAGHKGKCQPGQRVT